MPTTVSPEAQTILHSITRMGWEAQRAPQPDDLTSWKRLRDAHVVSQIGPGEQMAARKKVKLRDLSLGGVPALEILPHNGSKKECVILYAHGGAFTMSSARSRLLAMPSLANATGMRVISVDYTTAPEGNWQTIQSQALAAVLALRQEGYAIKTSH